MVPACVPKLVKLGFEVVVEKGAGTLAGYGDDAYAAKGATPGSGAHAPGCDPVIALQLPALAAAAGGPRRQRYFGPFSCRSLGRTVRSGAVAGTAR